MLHYRGYYFDLSASEWADRYFEQRSEFSAEVMDLEQERDELLQTNHGAAGQLYSCLEEPLYKDLVSCVDDTARWLGN